MSSYGSAPRSRTSSFGSGAAYSDASMTSFGGDGPANLETLADACRPKYHKSVVLFHPGDITDADNPKKIVYPDGTTAKKLLSEVNAEGLNVHWICKHNEIRKGFVQAPTEHSVEEYFSKDAKEMIVLAKVAVKAEENLKEAKAVETALSQVSCTELQPLQNSVRAKMFDIHTTQKPCINALVETKKTTEKASKVSSSLKKKVQETEVCLGKVQKALDACVDDQVQKIGKLLKQVRLSDFEDSSEGFGLGKLDEQADMQAHGNSWKDRRGRRYRRHQRSISPGWDSSTSLFTEEAENLEKSSQRPDSSASYRYDDSLFPSDSEARTNGYRGSHKSGRDDHIKPRHSSKRDAAAKTPRHSR